MADESNSPRVNYVERTILGVSEALFAFVWSTLRDDESTVVVYRGSNGGLQRDRSRLIISGDHIAEMIAMLGNGGVLLRELQEVQHFDLSNGVVIMSYSEEDTDGDAASEDLEDSHSDRSVMSIDDRNIEPMDQHRDPNNNESCDDHRHNLYEDTEKSAAKSGNTQDDECVLCAKPYDNGPLDEVEVPIILRKCGHVFGHRCFNTWFKVSPHNPHANTACCPLCRGRLREDRQVVRLQQELTSILKKLPEQGITDDERMRLAYGRVRAASERRVAVVSDAIRMLADISGQPLRVALMEFEGEHRCLVREDVSKVLAEALERLGQHVSFHEMMPVLGEEAGVVNGLEVLTPSESGREQ